MLHQRQSLTILQNSMATWPTSSLIAIQNRWRQAWYLKKLCGLALVSLSLDMPEGSDREWLAPMPHDWVVRFHTCKLAESGFRQVA